MKKLFFIVSIVATQIVIPSQPTSSTTSSQSDKSSQPKNDLYYKVNSRYSQQAQNLDTFVAFFLKIINWHKKKDEHFYVQSSNNQDKKEITFITTLDSDEQDPSTQTNVKIRYWINNTQQDPKFTETPFWNYHDPIITKELHDIAKTQRPYLTTAQQQHVNHLLRICNCTTTSRASFDPQLTARMDQFVAAHPEILQQRPINILQNTRRSREEETEETSSEQSSSNNFYQGYTYPTTSAFSSSNSQYSFSSPSDTASSSNIQSSSPSPIVSRY